jgi:hypothetical protein
MLLERVGGIQLGIVRGGISKTEASPMTALVRALQSQKWRGDLIPRLSRVTTHQRREAQFGFLGARSELNRDQHSLGCRSTHAGRI